MVPLLFCGHGAFECEVMYFGKTFFSFNYGTFSTEELVMAAQEQGLKSLVLANINSMSDCWDFIEHCQKADIHPVVGVEIRNEDTYCYTLLARNEAGFFAINRFLSAYLIDDKPFPLRCDSLGADVITLYPFGIPVDSLPENSYIGIQPHELTKLYGFNWQGYRRKFVLRHQVTFADKQHHNLHRLLRAIAKNTLLSKQEVTHYAPLTEQFVRPATLLQQCGQYPHILVTTLEVLESCQLRLPGNTDNTKSVFSASLEDDRELLSLMAREGLLNRYGAGNVQAIGRLEKELAVINELRFNAYFLITWDFIRYAQQRGFYHVGRGSGANSIVAYALQITDVDPIELDLYFERFLNKHRTSPPDFDIDFSWTDRDQVMQYIFKRYGKDHVALLGMYSTYQHDAAIRELGKVYGLSPDEITKLSAGQYSTTDRNHQQILRYANMLLDFPHNLSVHPCGMLISEKPLHYYTATYMPPKGMPTTQIDMFVAEKVGLYKFDVLSQRGLGHIRDTLTLIQQAGGRPPDIHAVERFKTDPLINANLQNGNTIGCFYIESPSMRTVLRKIGCKDYLTLVAASSIIRPGVGSSGMMGEYIYRYHHPNGFTYLHPVMKDLLADTFGIMIYQEDVIKVAHYYAGLDMAEADVLRRAMSGKYRGNKEMIILQEKFFAGAAALGRPEATSQEVWRQIASFAGYSFSKAHSASFAVESYQSLFLKTYYPVEFMVAVINNHGGFYNVELYAHELKKSGVTVAAPCVNQSGPQASIHGDTVYLGFEQVKGLKATTVEAVLHSRNTGGPFRSFQDFIQRVAPEDKQLEILIDVGAFQFTGKSKKELHCESAFLLHTVKTHVAVPPALFSETSIPYELPALADDPRESFITDLQLLGLPLCDVFMWVDADITKYPVADDLPRLVDTTVTMLGYFVCNKSTYTKTKKEVMYFGTWRDAKGCWIDTVHFPQSAQQYPFLGRGFYEFTGRVTVEFGQYCVSVTSMKKVGIRGQSGTDIMANNFQQLPSSRQK